MNKERNNTQVMEEEKTNPARNPKERKGKRRTDEHKTPTPAKGRKIQRREERHVHRSPEAIPTATSDRLSGITERFYTDAPGRTDTPYVSSFLRKLAAEHIGLIL